MFWWFLTRYELNFLLCHPISTNPSRPLKSNCQQVCLQSHICARVKKLCMGYGHPSHKREYLKWVESLRMDWWPSSCPIPIYLLVYPNLSPLRRHKINVFTGLIQLLTMAILRYVDTIHHSQPLYKSNWQNRGPNLSCSTDIFPDFKCGKPNH